MEDIIVELSKGEVGDGVRAGNFSRIHQEGMLLVRKVGRRVQIVGKGGRPR